MTIIDQAASEAVIEAPAPFTDSAAQEEWVRTSVDATKVVLSEATEHVVEVGAASSRPTTSTVITPCSATVPGHLNRRAGGGVCEPIGGVHLNLTHGA